jgi:hypothetical protein
MPFYIPQEHFAPENPSIGTMPYAYTPTVPRRLINAAAWHLGQDPDMELRVHPRYMPYIAGNAGASALAAIMNQAHQRDHSVSTARFAAMVGGLETCSMAEPRLLEAIQHPEYPQVNRQSVRIVSSEAGDPLLIQKNVDHRVTGVNLGLSLQELTIVNTVWPAGTLLRVRSAHRVEHAEPVTTIAAHQISHLGVLRLSAFALPPDERQSVLHRDTYDDTDMRILGSITMDEIREHVVALQQCPLLIEPSRR